MIMRPIIIFLLVFMHSFTMFTGGGWKLPDGIHEVPLYYWLAKLSFSFMLEAFVFISGYLLCFQLQNKQLRFLSFVTKKAKRLIIPSILFSALYFLLFMQYESCLQTLYAIVNGCGHLWYLPMIFWCFVIGYVLIRLDLPEWSKLLLCLIVSCFSGFLKFLPLQMSQSCYYIFFFYLGMYSYINSDKFKALSASKILFIILLYIISFISLTIVSKGMITIELISIPEKLLRIFARPTFRVFYSTLGLIAFYIVVNKILAVHVSKMKSSKEYSGHFSLPLWLVWLNSISFGIYIYQQFILKILYYYTDLPKICGTYALPWVGFVITLMISIILSALSLKTKFGRFLIG